MEFRILGPIEVLDDGVPVDLGAPKQRAVLAVLLLHANEVVAADRLVDLVWGEHPPRTAAHSVQIYVSELRKAFAGNGDVIVTRRPGYELRVDPESIDAYQFVDLVDTATAALRDGDHAAAVVAAGTALGLWRGSPLADFVYDDFAQRDIERLEEIHERAVSVLCEARLAQGHPLEAMPMLRDAVRRDPLREEPRRLLMLALFAGGRQAEALREFRDYRTTLADETGLDPSPELLRLEEQILLRDPSLSPTIQESAGGRTVERNPYKGLRAFGEADAADFFGRDALIEQLLLASTSPLTAVVGPSGSGKSSAVRAGLLPALREGTLSGSHDWVIVTMLPGRHPFAEFDAALRRISSSPAEATGPNDDASIVRSMLRSLPTESALMLLVVDQFEELFTLTDEITRRAFLRNLVTAIGEPRGRIRVLLTVRADFYDRPLLYPEFAELFTENVVNVIPLTPAGIEAAAIGPAQRVGVGFAPDLLAQLVSDMTDQPGSLPLFQYTLTELFDERNESVMSLDAYERIGGLTGALSRRADAVYESLDSSVQETARDVFLRLVKPTEDRYTRRPVPVLDLAAVGDAAAVSAMLTRFGEERLLTFDRDSQTGAATVEVSHEALLEGWGRLAEWLDDARFDLAELDGLMVGAAEWETVGRDSGYLLTGARLTDYEAWSGATTLTLPPIAAEYLAESTQARRRAEEAEAERVEREAKAATRARVRLWGMVAAIVALVAVVTFVVLTAIANRPTAIAFLYEGPDGGGWNDQMVSGLERGMEDFGLDVDVRITSGFGAGLELQRLVDTGYDLILNGLASGGAEEAGKVEASNPSVRFVHPDVGRILEMFQPEEITANPNVAFPVFPANEGSFLMGVVAARMTETGVVGFIGGMDLPVIREFEAGFVAGVEYVEEQEGIDIEVVVDYLSVYDMSGFQSPTMASESARAMHEQGADVIYTAAGGSKYGAQDAAWQTTRETGIHRWHIGVDQDEYAPFAAAAEQAPDEPIFPDGALPGDIMPYILTSMVKRIELPIYDALEDYANGRFQGGIRVYGLEEGGIDYATSGGYIDHLVPELEDLKVRMITGEIQVPQYPDGYDLFGGPEGG